MVDILNLYGEQIIKALMDTVYITVVVSIVVLFGGIILGVITYCLDKKGLFPNKILYMLLSIVINTIRSIPTMILLVLLLPVTKILVGRISGTNAALPTLIIGTIPFYARIVQTALQEVDSGTIEAAETMGMKISAIIMKVLIPESLPGIISGFTTTIIAIIGATTIAGMIGSGGLGNLAYYTGFQRGETGLILVCTFLILLLVFTVQFIGEIIVKCIDKR